MTTEPTPLVTLDVRQRPIYAVPASDPLVRAVDAYVGRLRAHAAELRRAADLYDALADNSEAVEVQVRAS